MYECAGEVESMIFPDWLVVYGDSTYRGDCPKEAAEQATFFNQLRKHYPDSYGLLALHPKNEGKRSGGQFQQLARDKALGLSPGAADVIIPGRTTFVCEIKRRDHTLCSWQAGQLPYLEAAHKAGCFVCVALGWEGAWQAFSEWVEFQ